MEVKTFKDEYIKKYVINEKNHYFAIFSFISNLIFFLIVMFKLNSINKNILYLLNHKGNTSDNIFNNINEQSESNNKFDNSEDKFLEPFIKEQNNFCENEIKFLNQEYEKKLHLTEVKLNGIQYKMYLYALNSGMRKSVETFGAFEKKPSINIYNALKYYKNKNQIKNNKDIYMIDIGGNIGWYPSFLGRYGYTILSFEPFEINNYIGKKNFCSLNRNSNVIIITKGLGNEEKTCEYYKDRLHSGNGMVLCNQTKPEKVQSNFIKTSTVEITRLSNFIPFLSNKRLALIKIDVEGAEAQVFEGGTELITKYHVPFIFLEFSPSLLEEHGSNPKKFVQFFVDNGYNISLESFLSKNYISVEELMHKVGYQVNCYFIYNHMVD